MRSHHRQYEGVAFSKENREIKKAFICGKIIVDVLFFFETIPDYTKPRFDKQEESNSIDLWRRSAEPDKIGKHLPQPIVLSDEQLLVCSPTVLGFSLDTKQWRRLFLLSMGTTTDRA